MDRHDKMIKKNERKFYKIQVSLNQVEISMTEKFEQVEEKITRNEYEEENRQPQIT